MKATLSLFLILLVLAVTGCRTRTGEAALNCNQIIEDVKHREAFLNLRWETAPQWVSETYSVDETSIEQYSAADAPGFQWLWWSVPGKKYHLFFSNSDFLRANVDWEQAQPTGDKLLECLGAPSHYRASYNTGEMMEFTLQLWYVDEGIMVEAVHFGGGDSPPPIDGSMRFTGLRLVRPTPVEAMVVNVYSLSTGTVDQADAILQSLKPWPSSWDAVEIVVDLASLDGQSLPPLPALSTNGFQSSIIKAQPS